MDFCLRINSLFLTPCMIKRRGTTDNLSRINLIQQCMISLLSHRALQFANWTESNLNVCWLKCHLKIIFEWGQGGGEDIYRKHLIFTRNVKSISFYTKKVTGQFFFILKLTEFLVFFIIQISELLMFQCVCVWYFLFLKEVERVRPLIKMNHFRTVL